MKTKVFQGTHAVVKEEVIHALSAHVGSIHGSNMTLEELIPHDTHAQNYELDAFAPDGGQKAYGFLVTNKQRDSIGYVMVGGLDFRLVEAFCKQASSKLLPSMSPKEVGVLSANLMKTTLHAITQDMDSTNCLLAGLSRIR